MSSRLNIASSFNEVVTGTKQKRAMTRAQRTNDADKSIYRRRAVAGMQRPLPSDKMADPTFHSLWRSVRHPSRALPWMKLDEGNLRPLARKPYIPITGNAAWNGFLVPLSFTRPSLRGNSPQNAGSLVRLPFSCQLAGEFSERTK